MPNSNIWKYAAQGDLTSLQRAVKEEDEDVDIQNKLGESAAHLASRGGHASLLLLLGKFGADFTLTDGGGRTPAHHAAAAGQLDCLRALAGPLGARLDIKDSGGRRPLEIAKGDGVRKFISNWMSEAASGRSGGGASGASGKQRGSKNKSIMAATKNSLFPYSTIVNMDESDAETLAEVYAEPLSNDDVLDKGHGCTGTAVKAAHSSQLGKQAAAAGRAGRLANDYHSYQDVEQQRLALRAAGSVHHHQQAAAAAGGVHNEMNSRGGRGSEQEEEVPMKATPSSTPLNWQPLYKAGTTRMPRCTQEEVGFTPQGLTLGMPKRPSWRGVVRSAPELHALEEQAFASWQHSLQQRPDAASISFYEPRLEYWRQLWRVLELSDVVIMIVDARNPLLHFSHALTLHIIDDQKAAPLLVLNKCDLIPMEAVKEWKSYFEQRYPGLTVVAASTRGDITTAAGGGCSAAMISSGGIGGGGSRQSAAGRTGAGGSVDRGAAAAIMKAVLECRLRLKRGDPAWVQDLKVSDIVGEDFDAILTEARARSKYSKRDSDVVPCAADLMVAFKRNVGQGMTGQLQSQQQQQQQQQPTQQQQGQRSSRVTVPAGGSSSISSLSKQRGGGNPSGISSEGNKPASSLKGTRTGLPPQHVSSQHPESSSDVDADEGDITTGGGATAEQQWGVKGTKAGRKLALKKKRAARRSQQQQLPSGPSTLQADEDSRYSWVDLGQDRLKGARKGMGSIDDGNDMKQGQTCSSGQRGFSADKGRAAFVDEVKKKEKGGAASAHTFQARKGTAMKRDTEDHTSVEDVMSTAEDSVMESEDGDHHHKWKDDADSLVSGADEDDDELKRQEEEEFEVVGWSGGPPQLDRKEGQEGVTSVTTGATGGIDDVGMDGLLGAGGAHGGHEQEGCSRTNLSLASASASADQDVAVCCYERDREKHAGPLIFKNKRRHVVVCMVGEPNVGKSSTLNSLLGTHRVAVSSHPGRTKHYQTHFMTADLMLCDCPGLVFPRAGVPLPMQVLYGSYPIARCRDPYSVVSYLCERLWPRLHKAWGLKKVPSEDMEDNRYGTVTAGSSGRPYNKAASTFCAHQDLVQHKTSGTHVEGGGTVAAPRVKSQEDLGSLNPKPGVKAAAETTIYEDVHNGDSSGLEKEEAWSTSELLEAVAAHKNWRSRRGGRLDVYRAANWVLRNALAGRPDTCLAFLPPQNTSTGNH